MPDVNVNTPFFCCLLCFVHTITIGEVTTLDHELLDDSVESRSLVTEAFFPCAQSTEVLSGLGDRLPVETNHNSAQFLISMCNIKVDLKGAVNWYATPGGKGLNCTLLVILGPFCADELCARKRKDAVNMSRSEMTTRCRLAMSSIIN